MSIKTDRVLDQVYTERRNQDAKWGSDRPLADTPWLAILMEEVGEVATETFSSGSLQHLREELIQVAAVAVAWIESIDLQQQTTKTLCCGRKSVFDPCENIMK